MLETYKKKITLIENEIVDVLNCLINASNISFSGVVDMDVSRFKEAKETVATIHETCDAIDTNIITTLALFSPEAKDLRKLVSYLKITAGLTKTASNIRAYNKSIIKNFKENSQAFTDSDYLQALQTSSIEALKHTLSIIGQENKDTLEDLFEQICIEVDKTEMVYEAVEKELLSTNKISVEGFAQNSSLLKTFRKLDKMTNRIMDVATALVNAKLDRVVVRDLD